MSAKGTIGFEEINVKLDRLIDVMATRDDLARIVDNMATKEDIAELKGEIADVRVEMATKDDVIGIRAEMVTKNELRELDDKFTSKFQEIIAVVDGLMLPISDLKMEYSGITMQLSRHEKRLDLLEKK